MQSKARVAYMSWPLLTIVYCLSQYCEARSWLAHCPVFGVAEFYLLGVVVKADS